jgi:hypothetical protein
MIIEWICIKIKSINIIKFLIDEFDLIMDQIKIKLCLSQIKGFN